MKNKDRDYHLRVKRGKTKQKLSDKFNSGKVAHQEDESQSSIGARKPSVDKFDSRNSTSYQKLL